MNATDFYEIQGATDGLNERARALFWEVFEDAARYVPQDAPKADRKRPGPLLDGLRRYVRDEVGHGDLSMKDALFYFYGAARAEGLEREAKAVMMYALAYFSNSGRAGGSGQSGGRSRGGVRRGGFER